MCLLVSVEAQAMARGAAWTRVFIHRRDVDLDRRAWGNFVHLRGNIGRNHPPRHSYPLAYMGERFHRRVQLSTWA